MAWKHLLRKCTDKFNWKYILYNLNIYWKPLLNPPTEIIDWKHIPKTYTERIYKQHLLKECTGKNRLKKSNENLDWKNPLVTFAEIATWTIYWKNILKLFTERIHSKPLIFDWWEKTMKGCKENITWSTTQYICSKINWKHLQKTSTQKIYSKHLQKTSTQMSHS